MENESNIEVFKETELTISIESVKQSNLKKYIDKEVMNERIRQIDNPKDRAFIIFCWMTGTRVTEAINVKKEDLNFKDGFIRIKWLKNRKFYERLIPMHHKLKEFLWLYTTPMKHPDSVFNFTRQRAEQITKKWLGCSPHKIRHSFAINFIKQSSNPGSIAILQKILGHSHIRTTMGYLDYVPMDQKQELDKIEY